MKSQGIRIKPDKNGTFAIFIDGKELPPIKSIIVPFQPGPTLFPRIEDGKKYCYCRECSCIHVSNINDPDITTCKHCNEPIRKIL